MSRDIKFRAWDKKEKRIYLVLEIHFESNKVQQINGCLSHDRVSICLPDNCRKWRWIKGSDIELMQYTGLKDKNMVEIYEGDILCSIHPTVGNQKVVEWKEYRWNIMQGKTWVVVGNIYENGSLLKDNI